MASKQTGRATVFGIPNDGTAATITGIASLVGYIKDSVDIEQKFQVDQLEDEDGEPTTLIHSGEYFDATINFTPLAAVGTNTVASALGNLAAPAKGTVVTLTHFGNADLNSAAWVFVGGWKVVSKKKGITTFSMNLRRGKVNDLSTAVT